MSKSVENAAARKLALSQKYAGKLKTLKSKEARRKALNKMKKFAWQAKALEMNGRAFHEIPDAEIKLAESRLEVYKAGKPWRDPE